MKDRLRAVVLLALVPALPHAAPLAADLRDTGLYAPATLEVRPENAAFSPQYPLWSDGAAKRRWLYLPPGAAIDASSPDAWQFPPGTKLWKEFSAGGRRIETRLIERLADGRWRFSAYAWNDEGTQASLAPPEGLKLAVPEIATGRYAIPSRADCLACHEGAAVPVLGFSAVQLSPELSGLAARGVLRNLPAALLESAPRIEAPSAAARAALGYLHGNCGHCHNDAGPLTGVGFTLAQRAGAPRASAAKALRSVAEHAEDLLRRIGSRNPYVRMPPLGVSVVDADGVALVERLIRHELSQPKERP